MKTDTEDAIRATATLLRESLPEWFACLSSVASGRGGAEIVRVHLSEPRTRLTQEVRPGDMLDSAPMTAPTMGDLWHPHN
jgi:hypothetical protein